MKNYALTVLLAVAVVMDAVTVRRSVTAMTGPGFSSGPMLAIGGSPIPIPPRPVNIGGSPIPIPPRPVNIGGSPIPIPPRPVNIGGSPIPIPPRPGS
jgi:hypothetical protein